MKTEDQPTIVTIVIAKRTKNFRLFTWPDGGSALVAVDDDNAPRQGQGSIIGHTRGKIIRREKVWTD